MNDIDIEQESLFPFNWKILGAFIITAAFILLLASIGLILKVFLVTSLTTLGLVIITTRYGLKIDIENRTYTVYTWLIGLKIGKPESFRYIEKFYINQVKEGGTYSAGHGLSSTITNTVYKAYMKLDTGEKIHLDTHRVEDILKSKLRDYKHLMQTLYRPYQEEEI